MRERRKESRGEVEWNKGKKREMRRGGENKGKNEFEMILKQVNEQIECCVHSLWHICMCSELKYAVLNCTALHYTVL